MRPNPIASLFSVAGISVKPGATVTNIANCACRDDKLLDDSDRTIEHSPKVRLTLLFPAFFILSFLAIVFITLGIGTGFLQQAYAIGGTVDGNTCASTFSGTWDSDLNTCTIPNLSMEAAETLNIPSGVTVVISSGSSLQANSDTTINIDGTMNINTGGGLRSDYVTLNVNSGGNLQIGGGLYIADNAIMNVAGTVDVEPSGSLMIDKSILNIELDGDVNVNGLTTIQRGTMNINTGGALNINSGGTLDIDRGTMNINTGGALNINSGGTLNVQLSGTLNINSGGTLYVYCGGILYGVPSIGAATFEPCPTDIVPPDTSITSAPTDPSQFGGASFTFTSTESGTFECQIDGNGFYACSSPDIINSLFDGLHTFQVRAVDVSGNTDDSPAEYTWTIDMDQDGTEDSINGASCSPIFGGTWDSDSNTCTIPNLIIETGNIDIAPSVTVIIPIGSTLDINSGGVVRVNADAGINTAGILNVNSGGTIHVVDSNVNLNIDSGGILNINSGGGIFDANTGVMININSGGILNINSGGLLQSDYVRLNVNSGGTLNIEGALYALYDSSINIEGTFNINSEGYVDIKSSTLSINSGGTLNVNSDGLLDARGSSSSNVNSGGTLNINSGGYLDVHSGGTLNINSAGTANVNSGGTLDVKFEVYPHTASGYLHINSGGTLYVYCGGILYGVPSIGAATFEPCPTDIVPPDTSITSAPTDPSQFGGASFTFTSTESGTFECQIDGNGFYACNTTDPVGPLFDGLHTFQVRAVDVLGNTDATPAEYSWTIDLDGDGVEDSINANSCEPIYGGTWDSDTDTCTLQNLTVQAGILDIPPGVTIVIPTDTSLDINSGSTLRVNAGAILIIAGTLNINSGVLKITEDVTVDINSDGIVNVNSGGQFIFESNNVILNINSGGILNINSGGGLQSDYVRININSGGILNINFGGGMSVEHNEGIFIDGTMNVRGTLLSDDIVNVSSGGMLNIYCGSSFNSDTPNGGVTYEYCEDSDLDGIMDNIDTLLSAYSDSFSDTPLGGTTSGSITTIGEQTLLVKDESNPEGVRVLVRPSSAQTLPATISACGGAGEFSLTGGDQIVVTCGSVTVNVIQGPVEVHYGAIAADATLETGVELTFDPETTTFTAPSTNPAPIIIILDGTEYNVEPGDTVTITTEITLNPDKDSFLRSVAKNTNEGANPLLMLQKAGQKRTLISFDLASYSGEVTSAKLRLYVSYIADNWGTSGRTIDLYKLTNSWVEGNGNNFKPKAADEDTEETKIRGSGHGVTWMCADDSNISNLKTDCNTKWNGGKFPSTKTGTATIANSMLGQWIEFDVTADVNLFLSGDMQNHGWLIKKTNEGQAGRVGFASSENDDTEHAPQLVLTFG